MSYQPTEDPNLTAYALGELDAEQSKQVEAKLADDASAREFVEQVRQTATVVADQLQDEQAPQLTDRQHRIIEAAIQRRFKPRRTFRGVSGIGLAVAAMILLAIGVGVLVPGLGAARRSASMSAAPAPSLSYDSPDAAAPRSDGLYKGGSGPRGYAMGRPSDAVPAAESRVIHKDSHRVRTLDGASNSRLKALGYVQDSGTVAKAARHSQLNAVGYVGKVQNDWEPRAGTSFNTDAFDKITDNAFKRAADHPLSTFSIDVDTASYAIIRRFLVQNHRMPPPGAVRIEEMINYFRYYYPQPDGDNPFSVNVEIAGCPWAFKHRLVRIGLQGRRVEQDVRPSANLVFLIDVSGSMRSTDKLDLLKRSMKLLVNELDGDDRIAIVVYAGATGLVLPSTALGRTETVLHALDQLRAGGSTNGGAGIELAYNVAAKNFIEGGINRVILATDGDFNVGVTNQSELVRMIEQKRRSGVFLSVLGFGQGNLKDSTMEKLADKGNGNYAYIDSLEEGRKVFVEQMSGTLITIAKDVKIQVEFNPANVAAYRLIGYENRLLAKEDFNDDTKDAGEIGSGHFVTALYEVVPAGIDMPAATVDALRYQRPVNVDKPRGAGETVHGDELMTVKLRYKNPDADRSQLMRMHVNDPGTTYAQATGDFKFAAAVAAFGMILRDSPHKGTATYDAVTELAEEGIGEDEGGYRREFLDLVLKAESIGVGR